MGNLYIKESPVWKPAKNTSCNKIKYLNREGLGMDWEKEVFAVKGKW